jgi:uncharacterized protein (DUF362 family)/NAD-dependent dihydropyrimidine dehydrogenase PreA subunit
LRRPKEKDFSRVTLSRSPDYQPQNLNQAVKQALAPLEPLSLPPGSRVLLKPNCLSAYDGPEKPVNTRAEVVEAVGRYLMEHHDLNLMIGDSGGMGSYGRTKRTYEIMGLDQVADRLGAELVNFEKLGLIPLSAPEGGILSGFKATAILDQISAIVNLPKLKTHLLTEITGAVKNMLGLLPGSLKRETHVKAPSSRAMAKALVDIYSGIKAKVPIILHLMDGITAMEGMGPNQGQAREAGWILASKDPVALDTAVAVLMGFDPRKVPILTLASQAGLGEGDPDRIELMGGTWEELPIPGFKRPFTRVRGLASNLIPDGLTGWAFGWLTEAKPRLIPENCERCNLCVEACPAQALHMTNQGVQLNREVCIECYCCLEHCPSQGIFVPRGLWNRLRGR